MSHHLMSHDLMSPEFLAAKFPRLYHLTAPNITEQLERHGLLSPRAVVDRLGIADDARGPLIAQRRPKPVTLHHPQHGTFTLSDNSPLSERALTACLDDGLSPTDWLDILAAKVFFWPNPKKLQSLLGARINRNRARDVLVFDTERLLRAHWDRVRLSPINSGSPIHAPARRGLATFSNPAEYSYRDWRTKRGRRKGGDSVVEISIDHSVADAHEHLIDIIKHRPE